MRIGPYLVIIAEQGGLAADLVGRRVALFRIHYSRSEVKAIITSLKCWNIYKFKINYRTE